MKKLSILLSITLFSLLFTAQLYSQADYYLLEGEQYRGSGANARLVCEGLQLDKAGKIFKVEGLNNGFWITNGKGVIIKKFSDMDDAIGYKLKRGFYYIYPNLKLNQGSASIRAYIK